MHETPDARIARTAARQFGIVSLQQAADAGLSDDQVRTRVATGRWEPVRRMQFRIAGAPSSWRAGVLSAVQAAGPGAVASHRTAASLHGLQRLGRSSEIEVTVPYRRVSLVRGVTVHRTRDLPDEDVRIVEGVPAMTGERTLIDLAARLDRDTLTALVDDAVCADAANRSRLHQRAQVLAAGRRGVGLLIRLSAPDADAIFRSWLEREGARVFSEGGLPAPAWNAPVRDERGLIGIVDAYWTSAEVVVELDGLRFHSSDAQRQRDRARDRRLVLSGRRPLRYNWWDIRTRPGHVVAEIAAALAAGPRGPARGNRGV